MRRSWCVHGAHDETVGNEVVAADETDAAKIGKARFRVFLLATSSNAPIMPTERASPTSGWSFELLEHLGEARGVGVLDAADEVLALDDLEVLERDGARCGMARIGIAVVEIVVVAGERFNDFVIDKNAGQREVSTSPPWRR